MSEPTGARRYGTGGGDAYYDAVKYGGYEGTREQFGKDQAEFAKNATAVAEAKEVVEQDTEEVRSTKETFVNTTVPDAITAIQQEGTTQVQAVTQQGEESSQQVEAVGTQWKDEVANEGRARVQAVEQAGTNQVQAVNDAGTTQVGAVNQAGADQIAAVEQAGAGQVQAVTDEGTTQVTAVEDAGAAERTAIEEKGEQTRESIPDDYTALSDEVDNLNRQISDVEGDLNVIFDGGNLESSAIIPTVQIGKAIADNGVMKDVSGYNATDYIELPDRTYEVSMHSTFASNLGTAFYDAEKNCLLMVDGRNVSNYGGTEKSQPQNITLPAPSGAKYIRATMRDYWYTQPSDFNIVPSLSYDSAYELIDENRESIDENRESIKEIADIRPGKNLINPQLFEAGAISGQSGAISTEAAFAGYVTSAFIPISENTDYMFSTFLKSDGRVSSTRKIYLLYDENKTPVSNTYFNQASLYEVPIANTTAKYIRVSSGDSNNLMLEEGVTRTGYEEYSESLKLNDEIPLTSAMIKNIEDMGVTDSLSGKKWAVLGDSFTDYTNKLFDSGKYAGQYASYPRLIAVRTGIDALLQFCLSGRTLAYPSDGTFTNSICCPTAVCYYQNIPEDVDYVTIMLGINDRQHTGSGSTSDGEDATGVITLGTITDSDTSTYYGAWNVVLGWLRENRSFAHVGIVISNGIEDPDWIGAIEAVAKKWGYPTLNLNGDDRCPVMIRAYNPDVPNQIKQIIKQKQAVDYDGTITGSINTHPNWQTHELESTIFEAWLRSL